MNTTPQPPAEIPDDLLHTTAAARLVPGGRPGKGIHVATLFRWVQQGRLRAWKVGGRIHVSRAEVLALIRPIPPRPGARHVPGPTRAEQERITHETLKRFGLED